MRHIPNVAFIGRNSKNFSPGLHQCPSSSRRKIEVVNALGFHLYKTWTHLSVVPSDANINGLGLVSIEIVEMQRAELLDDNRIRPRRSRLKIQAIALHYF